MSTNANPSKAEEIKIGITGALLMMPRESGKRREEIERLHHLDGELKEAIAEVKADSAYGEHKKRLGKVFGMAKATLAIMKILDGIQKPGDRAAVITQVNVLSEDCGYTDKDLVTLAEEAKAQAGQQADDQGTVFDKTSEGERRGGKDAQPKPMEQKAAAPEPAPTPGIPLDEALAAYEAARKGWSGKGRKPKELKEAEAAVEAAEKAKLEAEAAAGSMEAKPDDFDQGGGEGGDSPAAPKAANDLDDDLPPPAPRKAAPLKNAGGNGSYNIVH